MAYYIRQPSKQGEPAGNVHMCEVAIGSGSIYMPHPCCDILAVRHDIVRVTE